MRFDTPRQLAAFVGLIPSEYSSGASRHQGGITKTGNSRARRALVEGAWAYRHPAKVSEHIQKRINRRRDWPHRRRWPECVHQTVQNKSAEKGDLSRQSRLT
jgi:transposase